MNLSKKWTKEARNDHVFPRGATTVVHAKLCHKGRVKEPP